MDEIQLFRILLYVGTAMQVLTILLVCLWPRRRPPTGARTLVAGMMMVTLLGGIGLVTVSVVTRSLFAVIHEAYLILMILLPSVGVCTLWSVLQPMASERRRQPIAGMIGLGLLVPGAIGFHSSYISPYQLRVERETVALPGLLRETPLRVAVVADLQTESISSYEHAVRDTINDLQPDLLLLTGDYFQGSTKRYKKRRSEFAHWFAGLRATYGGFSVAGDTDRVHRMPVFFDGTDIRFLDNEIAVIDTRVGRIAVGGVALRYHADAAQRTIRELARTEADARILIAHRPDVALTLEPDVNIDLVVAGHTHGGQVVFPGVGPLITLSRVPRHVAAGGLHTLNDTPIYVSRGVGMERSVAPPVRFLCPPELTLLTLEGRATEISRVP